jgi:hypothetical protein
VIVWQLRKVLHKCVYTCRVCATVYGSWCLSLWLLLLWWSACLRPIQVLLHSTNAWIMFDLFDLCDRLHMVVHPTTKWWALALAS